ncbi:MAG TPA: sigma-54-dependent Fis family transcriptional regulator [Polyangia bacterium]|nr:sigma-54-dependent Fis family transcriptional regulator [Polyangia bacterium]
MSPRLPAPPSQEARELERLRRERDLYLRLLELGTSANLKPFLEGALALIVGATGASKGYLELYAEPGGTPGFSLAVGFTEVELEEVRKAVSTSIIGHVVTTGQPVGTASALDDPRFQNQRSVQVQRIQAVLCVPIGEPSIGVLYLDGQDRPGPFSPDAWALAQLFARQIHPLADRLLVKEQAALGMDHTAPLRGRLAVERVAGRSRALAQVLHLLSVAVKTPLPVLFTGESGTGKSILARALHDSSPRARGPFVEVNCAALPETLFESELFGAEKGAHSTATRRMAGKIDAAHGGTLLLDEIGEMPLAVQSKLLMFLQSRRYYRLGSAAPIEADVRVVAATNAHLEELVKAKQFREDLFYRLNVFEVPVPPLRERREDIVPVAEAIVQGLAEAHQGPVQLSRAAQLALTEGVWPGNVRQLENTLSRGWALAMSEGSPVIEVRHLFPDRPEPVNPEEETYEDATRRFQRGFLERALAQSSWNVSETARRIGLARSHLNDLIRAHALVRTPRK